MIHSGEHLIAGFRPLLGPLHRLGVLLMSQLAWVADCNWDAALLGWYLEHQV